MRVVRVRVVIVADRFGGQLGAPAAAQAIAHGWCRQAPHDDVEAHPLSDGAAGFLDAVTALPGVSTVPVVVDGPGGGEVPAQIALREGDGAVRTAYLDASHAAGRHLANEAALARPERLSSAGVGQLLLAAREQDVGRIVLGVADLACHDAGLGLLQALGAGEDLTGLPAVVQQWRGTSLVLAVATQAPLTGFHGASAALGSEHGVDALKTQELEGLVGRLTERVEGVLPSSKDLLTGARRRPERKPGAGAGGGVGYAVQLLGARTAPGAQLLLDEIGLRDRLAGALVVLATARYDGRTVHDGVVAEVATAALDAASPTVVLAEQVLVGRREGMSLGVSGSYGLRAGEDLGDLAARVARTWSPPSAHDIPPAPRDPA